MIYFLFSVLLINFSQILSYVDLLLYTCVYVPKNLVQEIWWMLKFYRPSISLSSIYLVHCVCSFFMYIWYDSHRSNFGQRFVENTKKKLFCSLLDSGVLNTSAHKRTVCTFKHELFQKISFFWFPFLAYEFDSKISNCTLHINLKAPLFTVTNRLFKENN